MQNELKSFLQKSGVDITEDQDEQVNLFLGSQITECIKYWIDRSFDFIDNENPEKPFEIENITAQKDRAYRKAFYGLDDETKFQLKKLLRESIEGVVFSTLLRFDQSPVGIWNIELLDPDNNESLGIANIEESLHEDLYKWIQLFEK